MNVPNKSYILSVDKGVVNDYVNTIAPEVGINPKSVDPYLYIFLRNHSKPVSSETVGDNVLPVRMFVSVRTDLTNEVLVNEAGSFSIDCTSSYPSQHPIDDTVLLAGKQAVDFTFDCGEHLLEVIQRTTIYPLGACVIEGEVYVYINVVIDHTLKDNPHFKTKGCEFKSIQSLSTKHPVEKAMLKKLAIVKGGVSDAQ